MSRRSRVDQRAGERNGREALVVERRHRPVRTRGRVLARAVMDHGRADIDDADTLGRVVREGHASVKDRELALVLVHVALDVEGDLRVVVHGEVEPPRELVGVELDVVADVTRHHRREALGPTVEDALDRDGAHRVAPDANRAVLCVPAHPVRVGRALGLVDDGEELAIALVVDAVVVLVEHRWRELDRLGDTIAVAVGLPVGQVAVDRRRDLLLVDLGLGHLRGLDRLVRRRLADLAATRHHQANDHRRRNRHHHDTIHNLPNQHYCLLLVRPGCYPTTAH